MPNEKRETATVKRRDSESLRHEITELRSDLAGIAQDATVPRTRNMASGDGRNHSVQRLLRVGPNDSG